ncbi:putative aspartyl glutamyl-trna(asn gln) amidotransferase subunit b protein [Phaeoacremonium minimum UCRPA7]|uniref:Glutamyl-tRNA(Gln) amidotransferase subunit B, mitochondrial n=1 Tax=Phaeoacremonium minimum (strain UCR-PA7) TaxID=1286976 RepID=R8BAV7_PHAM7|nr:putative aspartyl glutamyl-trna(asn gln) amidotransferase subunit b protein [Phaeoacremonium minimum UCRPA7]EON96463.1 putative aspartyl glutamyl-trna(asn gln) amidotransferase subunit b protein [Phaeoacremonium minimum UCRPA7]
MARIPVQELGKYLLSGQLSKQGCLRSSSRPLLRSSIRCFGSQLNTSIRIQQPSIRSIRSVASPSPADASANTATSPPTSSHHVPLRKQLKDQAKALKASGKKKKPNAQNQTVPGWELTVGIEIHAQLNTPRKLFSSATLPAATDDPNTRVELFDLAMPGSQPIFQQSTLIPAVRAALALNCDVQKISRWDRKHYFHWDQPSGYQLTQYYEPFAREGHIELLARDGIAAEDGEAVRIGIRQVQMEQDTAKTLAQPGEIHWLNFNRVGVPLIEIITQPDIHHPATGAALVRKVQMLLNSVDACVSGMETGGLRADVNVSVRRTDDPSGILGQRTEIKNLSSFKAVEDAIIAERDRQIAVLEAGGVIEGETRGWSLGSTETRRLRGKEGEVDYRYMPDPDLGPIIIGEDLVERLRSTMGVLPDAELDKLIEEHGLSSKDALALMLLDNGGRLEYFYDVLDHLTARVLATRDQEPQPEETRESTKQRSILASNWVLHELGRLTSDRNTSLAETTNELGMTATGECERVPAHDLADILWYLHNMSITSRVAKELLFAVFRGDLVNTVETGPMDIGFAIEQGNLWFDELSEAEYHDLAEEALSGEERVLKDFVGYQRYPQGKLMFLVGRMMKLGAEERIDPKSAERVMKHLIEEKVKAH